MIGLVCASANAFFAVLDLQECHLIPPSLFAIVRDVYQRHACSLGVPDYNVYHNTGLLRPVVRRNSRDEWLLASLCYRRTMNTPPSYHRAAPVCT